MKKVMGVVGVILVLLIFGLLSERPTTAQLDSVGRYQITSGVTREAWRIDTITGEVSVCVVIEEGIQGCSFMDIDPLFNRLP